MNFSCHNHISTIPTSASTDQEYDESVSGRELTGFFQDQSSMHSNGGEGFMSASIQKPLNEVESVCKYGSPSSCRNRKFRSSSSSYLNKNVLEEPLLYSSDKSILQVTKDADTWLALGNIVWVKAVHNGWWPAEVRDLRILDSNDSQRTARVLVELFKLQERVWVDTSVLSQFPKCFEERSKNTSEAFKDALKQALCKYENGSLKPSQSRCTAEIQSPTQHDKSPDASKTSVSTRGTDDDDAKEEGRGKRKRKTKIHFDEMAVPDYPVRKTRRLKIMRLLGLAAPVGSPFSLSHRSSS
ncbi:hypothetical protein KSP39_PZI000648 [Platanthera zijinensis]|uniref:PWWP domain-containing protein n=1 Tax=Platanthera zijinensis TaxID=2320716 RepID=A0AAP0C2L0_9ASPA